jgi:hypothetical protein
MIHLWLIASITMLPLLIIPTVLIRDFINRNIVVIDTTLLKPVDYRSLLLNNIVEYTKE